MIELIADFAAGIFLCNGIPHLAAGLRGELFPSPFGSPPGVGNSHPVVNVTWGLVNILASIALLHYGPVTIGLNAGFIAVVAGAFIGGALVASYFHRVRNKKH